MKRLPEHQAISLVHLSGSKLYSGAFLKHVGANIKNHAGNLLVTLFLFTVSASSQSAKELFANSGIWADYGVPLSAKTYPEFKGRLANISWSDIETSPNVWNWKIFDKNIIDHSADNMPVIFLVYTGMNAPQWLFSNGVPKVNETNDWGVYTGYSPYYLDADYNFYFKRMITEVRKHVQTFEPSLRNKIIGVQACFGSTGDQIAYKGNVTKQYQISDTQFDSLFKVYSLYYYNEYKNLMPEIRILNNPDYYKPAQHYWLSENCPGGWTKCGTIGKGFQLNTELDKKEWLYDIMNIPWAGQYVKSRSEINGSQLSVGWWTKSRYKNMFALMCYGIYWGLDWSNQTKDNIENARYDSALNFFNKYAGQKVPAIATNALCALKDVLDASDGTRFPASLYGNVDRDNKTRYENIQKSYAAYGAKLEDRSTISGNEYQCLSAKGTNDVGWRLLPGNYERYLHQVDANQTSAGYWNVDSANNESMFGRFARGFDLANGKNALYFDVEDAFLRGAPLNGKYSISIDVTYYDNGTGSWQLFYDAQSNINQASIKVTCGNTKTWKKRTIVLPDAYFGNRGTRSSDFYIKSAGGSNVIFSVVELSRPQQSATGFLTTLLPSFDSVCINATVNPRSIVLNAAYLNGSNVQVGPLKGYLFSKSKDGPFTSSQIYSGYGTQINATIYIKINTAEGGNFNGNIPLTGGGVPAAYIAAKGIVLNTSPALNAVISQISCPGEQDGVIDLQTTGGTGPFTYMWTNSKKGSWIESTQDIRNLMEANYTVVVGSAAGCTTTKSYSIVEPPKIETPEGILGPVLVQQQQSGLVYSVINPKAHYTYIWSVPSGATINSGQNSASINVKWGNVDGNVKVKSQDNCATSPGVIKEVDVKNSLWATATSLKIADQDNSSDLVLLPNPVKTIANLQFYAATGFNYMLQVIDINGKTVLTKKGLAIPGINLEVLDVQQLAAGSYVILITTNGKEKKQSLKLIKE